MRLLGAGDNVVDRYVTLGQEFPGGNAVNVAVFARRLGAETGYLGVLGDDESGRHVLASLEAEGVDTSLTITTSGPNAFAEVMLDGGDRVFVRSQRNVAAFVPTDRDFDAMADFDVVHTAYTGPFSAHVAEMASRAPVSFDFGTRYDPRGGEARAMLPSLFLASFSGSHLSPDEASRLAAELVARGAEHALVTRGPDGAYLADDSGVTYGPAEQVTAVDTLGAGDSFIAAVLVGLVTGRSASETLADASRLAAGVCTGYGAFGRPQPLATPSSPPPTKAGINP